MLEPDRAAIEVHINACFRYAGAEGFVHLKAFYHDNRVYHTPPVRMNGSLVPLVDAAVDYARRCANEPKAIVFCPPTAVFRTKSGASENDLLRGLVLSVELDQNPQAGRAALEQILGPPTEVVRSGGTCADGEPKLHVYWRLRRPAAGKEALAALKHARRLATSIAGGDTSNDSVVHPIRLPGSWHRKGAPRLCTIESVDPDVEIDLGEALAALTAAAPPEPSAQGNGFDDGARADWAELTVNIIAGRELHKSLTRLAAAYTACGMDERVAIRAIEAVFLASAAPRDERWKARFDEIPRAVRSARGKFAPQDRPQAREGNGANAGNLKIMTFEPIKYVVPGVIVEGLTLFAGKPKIGKSWLMLHAAFAVATGGFTLGEIHCPAGDVLYCAMEDSLRRLQSRLKKLFRDVDPWPTRLHFMTELPRLGLGGLDQIREWIDKHPEARMVVLDVLASVRDNRKRDESNYDADYQAVRAFQKLCTERGIAGVAVHHLRKLEADDPFDTVSGTLGLTGAVDSILILKRDSQGRTVLHGRGRDLIEFAKAIIFNSDACTWAILGDAKDVAAKRDRAKVLDVLGDGGVWTPNALAKGTGIKDVNLRKLLARMCEDGLIECPERGKYRRGGL